MFCHQPNSFENSLEVPVGSSATSEADDVSFMGVRYTRIKTEDGGQLYLTRFGLVVREQLAPENWYAPDWFPQQRTRLPGTSAIYKVPTKAVGGVSLDLVVRFSRVGEEVPLPSVTLYEYPHAEFNSPFEEFALVMQLRQRSESSTMPRIFTKRPLAIYLPAGSLQLWQTGRMESKIAAKKVRNPEVPLDILQRYILLYCWIEGQDAIQTADALGLPRDSREEFLAVMTSRAIYDLERHGFRMIDIKPQHILLRLRRDGSLLRTRDGQPAYALIDYELLERFQKRD